MLFVCILSFLLLLLTGCFPPADFTPPVFHQKPAKEVEISEVLKKRIEELNFHEAAYATAYYKASNDNDLMIKASERVLALYGEEHIMRQTMLDLIEALIEKKDFEKAQRYAQEYELLYPGSATCKKARYLGIRSYYLDTQIPDRDQSKTQKTLEQIEEFYEFYPQDEEHGAEIEKMKQDCYEKLLHSEAAIARAYLAKYRHFKRAQSYLAAQKRIEYIKNELREHVSRSKAKEVITKLEYELKRAHDDTLQKEIEQIVANPEERVQMILKSHNMQKVTASNKEINVV